MSYTPGVNGGRINLNISAAAGGSTSGAAVLISTGTVYLAGGSNVTLSQNNNSITIQGTGPTISRFEYPQQVFTNLTVAGQGSLSVEHEYVPLNVVASAMKIGGSMSIGTTSNGSMRTANLSLWMGIYTLNGSSLSLSASGSANNSFAHYGGTSTASTTANPLVSGMRQLSVPILNTAGASTTVTMPAGEYWIAAVVSSTGVTANQSFTFTAFGNNQVSGAGGIANISPLNVSTSAGRDAILFQGIVPANGYTMPSTLGSANIVNSVASYVQWANFYNAVYNATY
jgi:hypothetical protein